MYKYFEPGAIVMAISGREKGEIFIIIKSEKDYSYIVNGQTRTIENPKKKNKKHLHLLCKSESAGLSLDELSDALVKKYLNNYNKSRVK